MASKGTKVFRILYAVFTVLLIALAAGILVTLWNFLEDYEASRPEKVMNSFIAEIAGDKTAFAEKSGFSPNEFESENALDEYYNEIMSGECTYTRNAKKSTEETIIYDVKAGGSVIAEVTLNRAEEKTKFGLSVYEVGEINRAEIVTLSVSFTAPSNFEAFINDVKVSDKYIVKTGGIYPETERFHGLCQTEIRDISYKIDGFLNEPKLVVKDCFGNEISGENNVFTMRNVEDPQAEQTALEFSHAYSKYIVSDGKLSAVAEYLAPDMPIYDYLYDYENKWNSWHTSYGFLNESVGKAMFYDESSASVRVGYDHILYGVSSAENGEFPSHADYTVYLVKIDDRWRVTDLVFN